jgi:tetratricopeptide (TPR) repeat protein
MPPKTEHKDSDIATDKLETIECLEVIKPIKNSQEQLVRIIKDFEKLRSQSKFYDGKEVKELFEVFKKGTLAINALKSDAISKYFNNEIQVLLIKCEISSNLIKFSYNLEACIHKVNPHAISFTTILTQTRNLAKDAIAKTLSLTALDAESTTVAAGAGKDLPDYVLNPERMFSLKQDSTMYAVLFDMLTLCLEVNRLLSIQYINFVNYEDLGTIINALKKGFNNFTKVIVDALCACDENSIVLAANNHESVILTKKYLSESLEKIKTTFQIYIDINKNTLGYEELAKEFNIAILQATEKVKTFLEHKRQELKHSQDESKALEPKVDEDKTLTIEDASYFNVRAAAHLAQGRITEALDDYSKSISLNSKDDKIYYERGYVHHKQNNISAAISDYDKAINFNRLNDLAHFNLATIYFNKEKYSKAIEYLNKAISIDSEKAQYYRFRGQAYYFLKQYPEALNDYSKATQLNPGNIQDQQNISTINEAQKMLPEVSSKRSVLREKLAEIHRKKAEAGKKEELKPPTSSLNSGSTTTEPKANSEPQVKSNKKKNKKKKSVVKTDEVEASASELAIADEITEATAPQIEKIPVKTAVSVAAAQAAIVAPKAEVAKAPAKAVIAPKASAPKVEKAPAKTAISVTATQARAKAGAMTENKRSVDKSKEVKAEEYRQLHAASARGSDDNLIDNELDATYLYSCRDVDCISYAKRKSLYSNKIIPLITERAEDKGMHLLENRDRVFWGNSYNFINFADGFADDLHRIINGKGKEKIAVNMPWSKKPEILILPLNDGIHWRLIRVTIDYKNKSASILWSDPYGSNTNEHNGLVSFTEDLKAKCRAAITQGIEVLFSASNIKISMLRIKEINKSFDQQGRGFNGTNCGPIMIENAQIYSNPLLSNEALATDDRHYNIKSYQRGSKYSEAMMDFRKAHGGLLKTSTSAVVSSDLPQAEFKSAVKTGAKAVVTTAPIVTMPKAPAKARTWATPLSVEGPKAAAPKAESTAKTSLPAVVAIAATAPIVAAAKARGWAKLENQSPPLSIKAELSIKPLAEETSSAATAPIAAAPKAPAKVIAKPEVIVSTAKAATRPSSIIEDLLAGKKKKQPANPFYPQYQKLIADPVSVLQSTPLGASPSLVTSFKAIAPKTEATTNTSLPEVTSSAATAPISATLGEVKGKSEEIISRIPGTALAQRFINYMINILPWPRIDYILPNKQPSSIMTEKKLSFLDLLFHENLNPTGPIEHVMVMPSMLAIDYFNIKILAEAEGLLCSSYRIEYHPISMSIKQTMSMNNDFGHAILVSLNKLYYDLSSLAPILYNPFQHRGFSLSEPNSEKSISSSALSDSDRSSAVSKETGVKDNKGSWASRVGVSSSSNFSKVR